ncbi:MAG: UPF0149 family protein [Gammaproteobacteria bacterium]|nr:UPF0149 family protein [Gammaproteobacteria bacterium]
MNIPSYDNVKQALGSAPNLITPAELHGILCGLICSGLKKLDENSASETLMLDLSPETDTSEINLILNNLFIGTQKKIQEFELDFWLLLPDDECPLSERAYEFGKWCEGFISGMGLSGIPHSYQDQSEVDDILHKLSQAAHIEFDGLGYDDSDEELFIQVTEFVRLSVFSVYQELVFDNEGERGQNGGHLFSSNTLH